MNAELRQLVPRDRVPDYYRRNQLESVENMEVIFGQTLLGIAEAGRLDSP
jgi:hypothetical protein